MHQTHLPLHRQARANVHILLPLAIACACFPLTAQDLAVSGRDIVPATEEFQRNGEASMIALADGTVLLLYGAHQRTGDWDQAVLRAIRSSDRGRTWSQPETLFSDPERSLFQPALARLADGAIGLAYTSLRPAHDSCKLFRRSLDEGRTWSEPMQISDDSHSHTTGPWDKLVTLENGRVIALLHASLEETAGKQIGPRGTYTVFSDDQGTTWSRAPAVGDLSLNQNPHGLDTWGFLEPSVVEWAPGQLLMLARTSTGWLWESRSDDSGSTWSQPVRSPVPNPYAPPVLTRVPGTGVLVLLQNPRVDPDEIWLGARSTLAFRTSRDGGVTWTEPTTVLASPDPDLWFDYPAILWLDGDLLLACRTVAITNRSWFKSVGIHQAVIPRAALEGSERDEP